MSLRGSGESVVRGGRLEPAFVVQLVALTPLWLLLVVSTVSGGGLPPLAGASQRVAGIPMEAAASALAMLWTLGGLLVVSKARTSIAQSIGVILFTIPATIIVVLAPAWSLFVRGAG